MAIPDFQTIMLPLVQFASDGKEHSLREAIDNLASYFQLTKEERKELLPSGRQARFDNRVGWSRTHLAKAGLLISTRRGYFEITQLGKKVLAQKPDSIDVAFLKQFPDYLEFIKPTMPDDKTAVSDEADSSQSPEEAIESAYQRVRQELAKEILTTIKGCSPAFFERLVIDLLVQMGYGGTRKDAGEAIGGSGDGGIDGIIKEDRLGLDIVYIQAKRWENTVSRPEIQKFAGALQGQRARKGIFITTAHFSDGAKKYVSFIDSKIVLIDGNMLAQLMIDYNIGVAPFATYEMKRLDSDYFTEE
ncbi:restriction endonuclease [Candidatus Leptofilum sp.]|uniref:restriction endonuclease n=1 Tax=Candidatus Leptofilum sp. TaxID=3241576 RepID=UPI003B5CD494